MTVGRLTCKMEAQSTVEDAGRGADKAGAEDSKHSGVCCSAVSIDSMKTESKYSYRVCELQ